MALAGWRFFVLSPAFAIHWGLQSPGYQNDDRLSEVESNSLRFKKYVYEKIYKYRDINYTNNLNYVDVEIKKIKQLLETWPYNIDGKVEKAKSLD